MEARWDVLQTQAATALKRRRLRWLAIAFVIVLATIIYSRRPPLATVLNEYQGTALDGPAPDFHLIDQQGKRVALSDFRGRVVVLTFMDSQCQESCPLTASQLRTVYQILGADAPITFIGINVNVQANRVADVMAISRTWRLNEIPAWHFLTGSKAELEPVWKAYHVAVYTPVGGGELVHTPGVYLIDPKRQTRWYVSTPFDETGASAGMAPLSDLLVQHIRALLREG
jgi:protein SCO1/2